jgi:hypothetical protein
MSERRICWGRLWLTPESWPEPQPELRIGYHKVTHSWRVINTYPCSPSFVSPIGGESSSHTSRASPDSLFAIPLLY